MVEFEDTFGKILFDTYQNTEDPHTKSGGIYYAIERDDDFLAVSNSFIYFLQQEQFPEKERELLDLATGRVLELACGAGRMSTYLVIKGYEVLATDISPLALKVCQKRGLNTKLFDFTTDQFQPQQLFDTVLIFGNSLPVVGSPQGMVNFFNRVWETTSDTGIVLGDFNSPIPIDDTSHLAYHEQNRQQGNPIGLVRMRLRYRDMVGSWFDFWLPTREEFLECVSQTSWKVELIENPAYYFILRK